MSRRKRKGRPVDGILVLDKPNGITSNGALQEVKRLYGAAKAGHTGSLDPLATGILPLCFGEGTKFSQYLLNADKRYLATMQLGIVTDSGDADGKVISEHAVREFTQTEICTALDEFKGQIEQIPSMFSALKYKGEPLYKLARKGISVEREPRSVTVHSITLEDRGADWLQLNIHCSKGTYIRSLAADLGELLGCGAHISDLRRLEAGPYNLTDAHTMDELRNIKEDGGEEALDQLLLPVSTAVEDWPMVKLPANTAYYFRQGQPVQVAKSPVDGWVRIFQVDSNDQQEFIGLGEIIDDGRIAPRRLLSELQ